MVGGDTISDERAAEASSLTLKPRCGTLRNSSGSAKPEPTDRCAPVGWNDAGRQEEGLGCGIPQRAVSNGWSKAFRDNGWQISLTKKRDGRTRDEREKARQRS